MSNIARIMQQAAAGAAGEALAIEDVFSTYLYTGTGAAQTITNGIDSVENDSLVWIKNRSTTSNNILMDTLRGTNFVLFSESTSAQNSGMSSFFTSFNSDGFSVAGTYGGVNASGNSYASWTFRKAPRWFDCVTYTGDGVDNRTIAHNLGADIGTCIIKRTDSTGNWMVWHRSLPDGENLRLQSTDAQGGYDAFYEAAMTSTTFGVRTYTANTNINGASYVAYLFAHDPLGPSGDGSDGLIACGSYTGTGSTDGPEINLGWEPQWIMVKGSSQAGNWILMDNMRGIASGGIDPTLFANSSGAEDLTNNYVSLLPNGFKLTASSSAVNSNAQTYIYIAIRRGPMREPTSGTEVFAPVTSTSAQDTKLTTGFPVDMQMITWRTSSVSTNTTIVDRLRGVSTNTSGGTFARLISSSTAAEDTAGVTNGWDNTGFRTSGAYASISTMYQNFRRAPGFFDVVCYTGNGVAGRTVSHNLGVAPELMIVKRRNDVDNWIVYHSGLDLDGDGRPETDYAVLDNGNLFDGTLWNDTVPTATEFTVGPQGAVNDTFNNNYIAYLFATLPGVSKVGSYTGNGTSQTINCGFISGARFVLIKRSDLAGGYGTAWYVWDTARGIVAGNDPHLSLNTTAAEVTTNDSIDPDSSGFVVNQLAATNINVSSASYIYLAIS